MIIFELVLCVCCEGNWSSFSREDVQFTTTGSDTFTLTVREGQHVVVDHGKRGVPPQQGSSWSDVQSCELRGHVHRWIQTTNKAAFNEYCSRVFNEFSGDNAELILCPASGFVVVKSVEVFLFVFFFCCCTNGFFGTSAHNRAASAPYLHPVNNSENI